MIRTRVEAHEARRVLVLHGARNSWDLGYRTELFYLQRYSPNFNYVPVIDGPQDEVVPWTGRVGFAQDLWQSGIVADTWGFAPTPADTHVFLCGNPLMIQAMKDLLGAQGYAIHRRPAPGQIHVEEF
jgi:ferredoxin--NADP+ reductase